MEWRRADAAARVNPTTTSNRCLAPRRALWRLGWRADEVGGGGDEDRRELHAVFDWVPVGDDDRGFDYGVKFDVKVQSNLSKFLWDGFSATGHFELRYGDVPLLAGGTLIPTSSALLFPGAEGTDAGITSLYATQIFEHAFSCSLAASTRSISTALITSLAATASIVS